MIGRTNTGGGGGGGGLNFQVVGNPQPTNPKENTIWLNTDVKITGYDFTATEPETPVEGMGWISTGASSTVAFNALKNNNITVYPISAKQYISGAWVDVTAKSYHNGEWVDWMPEGALYFRGDERTEITGGWGASDFGYTWAGGSGNVNTITKNGNSMTIKPVLGSKVGLAGTKNKINLSGYSKITMKYSSSTVQGNSVLCLCSGRNVDPNNTIVARIQYQTGNNKTISLSLAGYNTGSYYVIVATDSTEQTTIDEIYLEK